MPSTDPIWSTPAGGSLMAAMLGLREPTEADRETLARVLAAPAAEPDESTEH